MSNILNNYLTAQHDKKIKAQLIEEVKEIRNIMSALKNKSNDELVKLFVEQIDLNNERSERVKIYAITTLLIERLFGLKLYDVQLQGAIALSSKNVIEMKTGEGKTITSSLPVIFWARKGKPVHVVTVNEYLAKRDKEYLEPLYKTLGFTVGLNLNEHSRDIKKQTYKNNIIYSTATELGFDYLNDNMVMTLEDKVNSTGYHYAIIDEVDLVLIDEARTPLIVGKPVPNPTSEIMKANLAVNELTEDDFKADLKNKTINLTESGIKKIEEIYEIDNLYSSENVSVMHKVNQALLANHLFVKDIDYAITNKFGKKEITIIDTFTGRLQFGRRFTRGLHQAIEAKHYKDSISIEDEISTVATITLQNFFRMYSNISGMSGTVVEERKEFMNTYGLNVVIIDPNKPLLRVDKDMEIYITKKEKWDAVIKKIINYNKDGNPILVGTVSVEDSETLSNMLKKAKIRHQVLNAKQDADEARIISEAGRKNTVTIATNMAGRGTDIKVDEGYQLIVMLTEINESSRIDNQLKGRTSRQGAPGTTETIISLNDSIFDKVSLADKIKSFKIVTPLPKQFIKLIRMVQTELENANYSSRNNALKYDDIIREQRTIFYETRDSVISNDDYVTKLANSLLEKETIERLSKLTDNLTENLRIVILNSLDKNWTKHIDKLEVLKSGIGWRAQSGHNPFIVYQNEAQILYDEFKLLVKNDIQDFVNSIKSVSEIKIENAYQGAHR